VGVEQFKLFTTLEKPNHQMHQKTPKDADNRRLGKHQLKKKKKKKKNGTVRQQVGQQGGGGTGGTGVGEEAIAWEGVKDVTSKVIGGQLEKKQKATQKESRNQSLRNKGGKPGSGERVRPQRLP